MMTVSQKYRESLNNLMTMLQVGGKNTKKTPTQL